jgi:hypothetical protein
MSIAREPPCEARVIINQLQELDSLKGVAGSSSNPPPEEYMEDRFGAKAPPIDDSAARARTAIDDAKGAIKDAARDAKGTVSDTFAAAKDAAKDKVMGAMDTAQTKAADQARTASATLRDTADRLDGELPWMKTALSRTADGFDHLTTALNRGDLGQALNGVSDFARRQPALFIGLSVAAGFALARVGKTALEGVQPAPQPRTDGVADAVAPYAPVSEI